MNGELIRQLFRSYAQRDDAAFSAAAHEIILQERQKNHRLLADDLERILRTKGGEAPLRRTEVTRDLPRDRDRGLPLVSVQEFDHDWSRLIVPPQTLEVLEQVEREYRKREILRAAGIAPKQRMLFYGPPGCGKTMAAKVLSSMIGFPLVTVRLDGLISSFLGETAANLRKVFDFIETGRWVVLFDEFDAIGMSRGLQQDQGELRRVVNSLLQMFDDYEGESLLVAATNYEGGIDAAIWRRFDGVAEFPRPTYQSRVLLLNHFFKGIEVVDVDTRKIAKTLQGATGADIERVSLDAYRRALVSGRTFVNGDDIRLASKEFRKRLSITSTENASDENPS